MTTHYIDITLLPDPEFSHAHLLGALVAKLHRVLVQLRADDIGISFPQFSERPRSLGRVLRLHGSEAALQHLIAQAWLQGMRDHVKLTPATPVPAAVTYRVVQRRQFKTNAERLRRRRMRRKGETAEQAAAAIPDSIERQPDLPYVQLRSVSTGGQPFCLFVEQREVTTGSVPGKFNSYGLSQGATVPWF
ncbi:type I-F CRISPR-associated endoribonuclease Cas6/Csy4 [Paraburkholderia bonniea]|uniref:type I-F CRISPR-associated endoribonuclease Cas6/Csy4 n=1 Tax=Paraburkholderia bonniea TaxID=2152891 RepID=UPI0012909E48|nr:type I-F CRISPR-associated endoribonuclease Cas6/Csy4 [Paraburkholderia bonniea]WJF90047.1 type I-F CRISPR-associated endoribonuclease Cas6/Csy4 [Paraburkholderia bonniea]WJF93361.1 type I-F CRISPR-associated endoribonuclease Cas6/Csy4 [Paraburkholderia bonniea]